MYMTFFANSSHVYMLLLVYDPMPDMMVYSILYNMHIQIIIIIVMLAYYTNVYCIAGIFRGGKYSFFSNKLIFVGFIFVFASSAPFYNTGGHTHLVKFCSLDLFLNEKNEN